MTTPIILKYITTAGQVPSDMQMDVAEPVVNTADAQLYLRHTDNVVRRLGTTADVVKVDDFTGMPANALQTVLQQIYQPANELRPGYIKVGNGLSVLPDGTLSVSEASSSNDAQLAAAAAQAAAEEAIAAAEAATAALANALINPMTSEGDVVVGGAVASGHAMPSRLGVGSGGQVLTAISGHPAWATPTDYTPAIQQASAAAASAVITASSAQTIAGASATTASEAQTAANAAQLNAASALSAAATAQTTANNAQTAVGTAQTTANTALSAAANAQSTASAALPNPMTASGDIIVGGTVSSGKATPTRLARGTDGQVLKLVSGTPSWSSGAAVTQCIPIACSDETTSLTAGSAKVTFRMPFGMTITQVRASVNTAPTGSTLTVDIREGGTSILSSKLTIDATEKSSVTASTPVVVSNTALADDAEVIIDILTVGSIVAGKGLKVYIIGLPV